MSETFGRYTVISQLGKGAMGVVYLASDPVLNRQVAVKTVDLSVQEGQERDFLRERLFRDARAAAVLKHPNIVAIYDVFEDAGRAYVVMEYIEGDSLAARLKSAPPPDGAMMMKVLRQMADALDYTHARGVIHRDIKPANVMIDPTGTTKIMDFGIARIADTRTCTPTGMVMGTVEYMAPEQILGEPADGRVDQFALAVVAYQMMTGSTLFGPNTVATLTYKIVNEAPPLPSTRNAAIPRGVDAVLGKALAKKPGDRFETCMAFVDALERAFADAPTAPLAAPGASGTALRAQTTAALPVNLPPVAVVTPPVAAGPPRSNAPVVAAAVVVLLLGGALAAVILKPWTRFQHPAGQTAAVAPAPVTAPPVSEPAPEKSTPAPNEAAPAASPNTETPKVEAPKPVEVAKPEPVAPEPKKPEPVAVAPKKTEPITPTPPKAVAPPPKSTVVPGIPEPVMAPEPTFEMEPATLPKEKSSTPYTLALKHGQEQVKADDYVGALHSFGDAVGLQPNSAQAHYSRGLVFQHLQQFDAAMRDYNDAIRLEPTMATAYVALGNALVHEHRDPEALTVFQRAISVKPDAAMALFGIGNIYMRRKEYGAALANYDKVLKISPRYAPAYMNRANARQAIGDFKGAAADRMMEQSFRK